METQAFIRDLGTNVPWKLSGVLRAPDCIKKTPVFMRDLGTNGPKKCRRASRAGNLDWSGTGGGGGSGTRTSDPVSSEKVVVRESSSFKFEV